MKYKVDTKWVPRMDGMSTSREIEIPDDAIIMDAKETNSGYLITYLIPIGNENYEKAEE